MRAAASNVPERPDKARDRRGMSLVEVLVAVTLLGVAMLSLGAAAGFGVRQMGLARQDLQYAADVQQEVDSLSGLTWNSVTNGSANVRGRAFNWTVSTPNANSRLVTVIVQRRGHQDPTRIFLDTVVVYMAKPTPGS
ncbi:MAG: prepilin-type N-terminal cleavage/methylation domain-containing protein [Gemmatimonadaceae bacterium]